MTRLKCHSFRDDCPKSDVVRGKKASMNFGLSSFSYKAASFKVPDSVQREASLIFLLKCPVWSNAAKSKSIIFSSDF